MLIKRVIGFLVVLILTVVPQAGAQSTTAEQEVAEARRQQAAAQAECRTDVMAKMRTPDYVINFPNAAQGSGADVDKNCTPRKAPTEEGVLIRVYGGDTAIVTGVQQWYRSDGTPMNRRRFTSVWIKADNAWRHASFHATLIPDTAGSK